MSLNIKNEQAHRLAVKLSKLTGESLTDAVTRSLRERLERVGANEGPPLAERLVRLGRHCAVRLDKRTLAVNHGDLLYDDKGLPK